MKLELAQSKEMWTPMAIETPTHIDGLTFPEGPRWHASELWCSDMHGHRVLAVDENRRVRTVVDVEADDPSGLGWLPDGRLLIVGMESQAVFRLEPGGELTVHADLSGDAIGSLNDMIVAADGMAYVGDMGIHIQQGGTRRPGQVIMVRPDGRTQVVARGLISPNGMILNPGEDKLLVAQSGGSCITEFDRGPGGELSGPRVFAPLVPSDPQITGVFPDGICLDEEGAVWFADPVGHRVARVRRGGAVTDSIEFAKEMPVACVLGGEDRRTLFVCTAPAWKREELVGTRNGRIAGVRVSIPGVGKP